MAATVDEETWGTREVALTVAMTHVSEENRALKEQVSDLKDQIKSDGVYLYLGWERSIGKHGDPIILRRKGAFLSKKSLFLILNKHVKGGLKPIVKCDSTPCAAQFVASANVQIPDSSLFTVLWHIVLVTTMAKKCIFSI